MVRIVEQGLISKYSKDVLVNAKGRQTELHYIIMSKTQVVGWRKMAPYLQIGAILGTNIAQIKQRTAITNAHVL